MSWLTMAAALTLSTSCADSLGDCDMRAATQVVYSPAGLAATKGQALIHDSCGAGALCHSSTAEGESRYGAPSSLSFDMCPQPRGWTSLVDHGADVWKSVEREQMPPPGHVGRATVTDSRWSFDPELRGGAVELPSIHSKEGKGMLRNWLACGAPVVGDSVLPAWARPGENFDGGGSVSWDALYSQVIAPKCATGGCHDASAQGELDLSEPCEAHRQLLAVGTCMGMPRISPGQGSSYLLSKLESDDPACGSRMPTAAPLPDGELSAIRSWVEAGAAAPGCE